MRVFVVKTCAVVAVLATALAMAQSNAPSQPGASAPQQNNGATAMATGQNTVPSTPGTARTVAATPDTRSPNIAATPVDQAIQRQVQAQFAHKAEFQNVSVSVDDGVVTLEGSVPTKIERRQAKALARSVNGVKKVQERLTLSGDGVSGPGTVANTTTTAQNDAGSISGNTKAQAGTAQGTSAMSQTPSSTAAPSLNRGTQPANAGSTGGISGAAVGNSAATAPPSSNIGAGASNPPSPPPPVARTSAPARQPQDTIFGLSTVDTAGLASKINTALKNDPTLANNNVMVNVSDQGVEVTGSVDTGKEKLTAMRIAQSYAGNFKVVDRVTLAGRTPATNAQQAAQSPQAHGGAPPSNVVGGSQVLPSGTANNGPSRDPKTAGDKSSNPR
jgi:osmotically-inducible protein OsmY